MMVAGMYIMKRKTIEAIVADLSDEELESFRDLIDECLVRERDYIEMDTKLKDDITRLGSAEKNFLRSINILSTRTRELQNKLESGRPAADGDRETTPPSGYRLH